MPFSAEPIKRKLVRGILLTTLPVLLLACLLLMTYEVISYRRTAAENLATLADIIAANSTASLIYDDPKVAREILSGLKAEPEIEAACLYNQAGKLYAVYPTNLPAASFPSAPGAAGLQFQAKYLSVFQPVIESGNPVGTLYVRQDLHGLFTRLLLYGSVVLAVLLASAVLALLLSKYFQKQISQPILELAETAHSIADQKDFSVRAHKTSDDEIGLLTDAFNTMLGEIQTTNRALHHAQLELKAHAQELEHRVADRTARLSETVAELESFSYSISHDMRAPLRAMQGYAAFLLESADTDMSPEAKGYLRKIMRSANRLDTLIQDILTYSRLSKAQIRLAPVNVEELLADIIQEYPSFQPPHAQITVQKPIPRVMAHAASLTQVLSNLLGNATKFVSPGQTPVVRIWAEEHKSDLRLWIEDNGIGIAPKDQQRIFSIFERVHATKDYEGTGIGLSIVRKAIDKMGGSVGLESEVGQGSRFWIELPKAEDVPGL